MKLHEKSQLKQDVMVSPIHHLRDLLTLHNYVPQDGNLNFRHNATFDRCLAGPVNVSLTMNDKFRQHCMQFSIKSLR